MNTNFLAGILTGLCIIGIIILATVGGAMEVINALFGLAGLFGGFLIGNNKTAIIGAFKNKKPGDIDK